MKEEEYKSEFNKKLKQVKEDYSILEKHINSLFIPRKESKIDYSINSIHKISEKGRPNIARFLEQKRFDLIINIPKGIRETEKTDNAQIRKQAIHYPKAF